MDGVTGRLHNRIDLLWSGEGYDEARANATCYPGTILAQDSAGELGPHASDGACYGPKICLNWVKQGKLITDTHLDGALVPYIVPRAGDCFNMLVESAESITLDDYLTVTASGSLRVATGTDHRLFQPLETLVGTGSGDRFCKCRFIR